MVNHRGQREAKAVENESESGGGIHRNELFEGKTAHAGLPYTGVPAPARVQSN